MRIVTLEESDAGRYREFCARAEHFMLYYAWEYRRLLVEMLGCRPIYLAVEGSDGHLRAALPIMAHDGRYGTVLNSLPFFGSHGGVIGESGQVERMLWDEFDRMARAPGIAAATVVMNPLRPQEAPFNYDLTDERLGLMTRLDGGADPDALRARIAASARYDVRLSQRAGIEVGIDNAAFPELEAIHRERIGELGGVAKPHEFFALLPKFFAAGDGFDIYVARREGQLVAAVLMLYAGGIAEYFIPVVRPEYRSSQPTAAILFQAMLDAARRGMRLWNWGGTWASQDGVRRFKRNWGGIDRPYRYYIRINNPALYEAERAVLLDEYAGFYVLPFDKLKRIAPAAPEIKA